jgi:hypothetical protein
MIGVFYAQGNIAVELREVEVPELAPGKDVKLDLVFKQSEAPLRVRFELLRPAGFSAWSVDWTP